MTDPAPLTDADPAQIGGYPLVGRLGRGGQGVVYLGHAPDGTRVAVKTLHGDALDVAGLRRQLAEEVEMARRVARFCTAQVLDADVQHDPPYVVSEYVAGPSLGAVVRGSGPLRAAALERLAVGTLTALAAIHQAGIVHRDLKPGNVLMASGGPRVIDFGIARALEGTAILTSRIAGTPAYMAPEQIVGGPLGPAVDLFAWGATLVYAANGSGPFGHGSLRAVVDRVVNDEPELGELDGRLRRIVQRCLDKDADRRPTAAEALMWVLGVTADPEPGAGPDAPAATEVAHQTLVAGAIAAADTDARESTAVEIRRLTAPSGPQRPAPHAPDGREPGPAPVPSAPPSAPRPVPPPVPPPPPDGPRGPGYPGAWRPGGPHTVPPPGYPGAPPPPGWAPPSAPPPMAHHPAAPPPQYPGQRPSGGVNVGLLVGVLAVVALLGLGLLVLVLVLLDSVSA